MSKNISDIIKQIEDEYNKIHNLSKSKFEIRTELRNIMYLEHILSKKYVI